MLLGLIPSSGKRSGSEIFITVEREQVYLSRGGIEACVDIRSFCFFASLKVWIDECTSYIMHVALRLLKFIKTN
jgi:hypothetical protein